MGRKALGWWAGLILTLNSVAVAGSDLRLLQAVQNRDQAAVRSLLKQHVDVKAQARKQIVARTSRVIAPSDLTREFSRSSQFSAT